MNDTFDNVFIDVLNESGFLKRILSHRHRIDIIEKVSVLYTEIKNWFHEIICSISTTLLPISNF